MLMRVTQDQWAIEFQKNKTNMTNTEVGNIKFHGAREVIRCFG